MGSEPTEPEETSGIFEGMITPEMAAKLLESNTKNRRIRDQRVDRIVDDILAGEWIFNGDTIKVAKDGLILDGQHRLKAIVNSGRAVPGMIVYGLEERARATVDIGARRNLSDELTIQGYKYGPNRAAVLNLLHLYRSGETAIRNPGRYRLNVARGLVMAAEHPEVEEYLKLAGSIREEMGGTASITLIATSLIIFDEIDKTDSRVFWTKVGSGTELGRKDPRYMLRETFTKNAASKTKKVDSMVLFALTIKAWNYYRNGAEPSQLSYRLGGSRPEQFPQAI